MPKKKEVQSSQIRDSTSKEEMNLVEFPFATLNHRDKRTYIECAIWHMGEGEERYQQKWIVSGDGRLGLPHEIADKILIALFQLWWKQGKERKFSFRVYQILKILELPDTKHYYELVKTTLLKLDGLRIRSEKSFWDKEARQYMSLDSFGLFDRLHLMYCVSGESITEKDGENYIIWGEPVWESLKAGNLKNINLDFYLKLERPLSRRLYRFLDKRFYRKEYVEIDIFDLASRLGMRRYKYPSKVTEKLQPAFDELIEQGFLATAKIKKVGKYTRVRFEKVGARRPNPALEAVVEEQDTIAQVAQAQAEKEWEVLKARYEISGDDQEIWEQVLLRLEEQTTEAVFHGWLAETLLLGIEDGNATVGVKNKFAVDWVGRQLERSIRQELNGVLRERQQEPVEKVLVEVMEAGEEEPVQEAVGAL